MSAPTGGPGAPPQVPEDEGWEYVDPSAYSNPYTESPVYTSGPLPPPSTATPEPLLPPLPVAPPTDESQPWLTAPPPPPPPPPTDFAVSDAPPTDASLAPGYQPEPGELKIKERRAWKTWQLATAVVIAALVGMWINGNSGSASGVNGGSSSGAGYKLPPSSASTPTTTVASSGAATATTAAGATTTTTTAGATTTTPAGGATATTTPVAVGPATILVPTTQQTGNWTSPAFTIAGGTWNIGWAFQCAPAPTGGPSFQIFAVTNGSAASGTPAVTSTAASGQSVTPLTSAGSQQVIVQTTAACRWAVKVTGSSS